MNLRNNKNSLKRFEREAEVSHLINDKEYLSEVINSSLDVFSVRKYIQGISFIAIQTGLQKTG